MDNIIKILEANNLYFCVDRYCGFINVIKKNRYTPLHEAAVWGQTEIAKVLIEKGAEVNARDKDGDTPLYKATEEGHHETVVLLKSYGAR